MDSTNTANPIPKRLSSRSRAIGVSILLFLALMYGCWHLVAPTATWRYRLTLTVNDNGTLRTGSSVIEIGGESTRDLPLPIPGNTGGIGVGRGEAVAVDLGEKGILFALLRDEKSVDHAAYIFCEIFEMEPGHGCAGAATPEGIRYYAKLEGKADLPIKELPMLVRFRDINDPKTIEKVDPRDLEASFGTGVTLDGATIEMTDDSVTAGIEKWLPWLGKPKGAGLGLKFFDESKPGVENYLTRNDFQKE